jgi:NAD(P)-dependent dehydrogenase (short-subunit alcohol dehydrogenase family)
MRLKDKIALITGGTSGIGRRTIERFVEEGATVTFTGRRPDLGAEVAAATGATFIRADAASEADAEATVKAVLDTHGRIDILMNNAGGPSQGGRVEDLSLENFDKAIATHVRGALAHIKYAAPSMRARGQGAIINVGSIAGHRTGYTTSMFYAIAKAAVIHMTRCVSMDLGENGVRVNAISPGVIATGIFAKAAGMDDESAERTVDKVTDILAGVQAIPRAGITDDIANAAVYLGSDEASFVNGEDIVVDGGLIPGLTTSQATATRSRWAEVFRD